MGRNDGEFAIRREEGFLIAAVVGVNDGKMPVVGSTRVTLTFKDVVDCFDVMLGEDDS